MCVLLWYKHKCYNARDEVKVFDILKHSNGKNIATVCIIKKNKVNLL